MSVQEKKYVVKRVLRKPSNSRKPPSKLSSLDLEITERCNNNCLHCGINLPADDEAAAGELSTQEICVILKEAADLGCLTVRITGGEPLLRPDFEDIYLFARRCGLKVVLFTNATLITPAISRLLHEVPPLEPLEITVYGMTPSTGDGVTRNPGSQEEAQRGIENLLEYGIPFIPKFAVLPLNQHEVDDFFNFCRDTLSADIEPSLIQFFGPRVRRDSEKKNAIIRRQRLGPEGAIDFYRQHLKGYFEGLPRFFRQFSGPQGPELFGCDAGIRRGCVDAYGGFSPCLLLKDPDCTYDLRTGTLEEALTSFFPDIIQRKAMSSGYRQRCSRCFLKSLCEQCPARSWMEHGVLDEVVQYYCDLAHMQARHLGIIDTEEYAWQVSNWQERIRRLL